MDNEKIDQIATAMTQRILEMPEDSWASIAGLLTELFPEVAADDAELFELLEKVRSKCLRFGRKLDFSCHDGKYEGLPITLEFQVRKTMASRFSWKAGDLEFSWN